MARTPIDVSNIDLESLSDGQIRDIIKHASDTLRDRFTSRLDEFRLLAHEAGYEIVKRGEATDRKRRRRSSDTGDTDDRRGVVLPKFQNPMCYSLRWFQSPIVWNRNPFSVRFEKEGVEWPNQNLRHCTVQ